MRRGARGGRRGAVGEHVGFDPSNIFVALNAARVKYLVIGGLAVILHGVDRHTWDVDLAVELTTGNLKALEQALERIGFYRRVPTPIEGLADPKTRRIWTGQRNMKVYSFIERSGRSRVVDVMVNPPTPFDAVYRRRVIVRPFGVTIPLVPVDVLIRLKQQAARPQDFHDIANLKQLRKLP